MVEVLARIGEVTTAEDQLLEDMIPLVANRVGARWNRKSLRCSSKSFEEIPLSLRRRFVRFAAEKLNSDARGLSFERIEEVIHVWEGKEAGPRDIGFGLSAGRKHAAIFMSLKG